MQKEGKTKQEQILFNFEIEGNPVEIVPLGNGLINDTYKVNMPEGAPHDYVLQRINHHIFTDVELLQPDVFPPLLPFVQFLQWILLHF